MKVAIADVKSYWDKQPCNSAWNFTGVKKGTRAWFEKVEERKFFVEAHTKDFANFSHWGGRKVLEIGCGICTHSIAFAKAGANVTVVDLSTASLALCKERFTIYGLKATFYQGDATELFSFLPGQKFDLVYSFGVIHHSPDPEKIVRNLTPYMKRTSEFRFMMYSRYSYKLFSLMHQSKVWDFSKMDSIIAMWSEAQVGSPVTYTYGFDDIERLCEQAGLEVVRSWKDHIFKYDVASYKRGNVQVAEEFSGLSPARFRQMENEMGWHMLVHARLARKGKIVS